MNKRNLITVFIIFMGIFSLAGSSFSTPVIHHSMQQDASDYIDLSVEEVWVLLSDTSNGIQLPIDVRTDGEWISERIDTPFPEFPRHFEKADIVDAEGYQEFVDLYDGNDIIVYCKSGGRSATAASVLISRGFNGTVYNMLGGITAWKGAGYPTKTGNTKPTDPDQPTGESICNLHQPYDFSTQATDPDDDPIRYGWDWNADGLVDEWSPYVRSGETNTVSHMWSMIGSYDIAVLAQDNVGSESSFSTKLGITINSPPSAPDITGPEGGKAGKEYDYTIVSEDIDGDDLSYFIEWGDDMTTGWTRTLPSGEPLQISYIWEEKNTYTIRVQAKDQYEAESEWSSLEVTMPKTHSQCFLLRLLSFYPKLEPLFNLFY